MSPGPRRSLLAALLVLAGTVIAGTVVAGTAVALEPPPVAAQQGTPSDGTPDNVTEIRVALQGDSDARWTVTERFNVTSPAERAAFEDLADRFRDGEAAQLGLPAFRASVERVGETVERPMRLHEVQRDVSVDDGRLSLSFVWTNFAREDNETRIVDDAFTTADGTWLDSLGPDQSLIVELPHGSALDTPKRVTDGTIRWNGPTEFERGYLQISYTATPDQSIPPIVWGVLMGLLVFAVVGVVGGYLLTRRDGGISMPDVPLDRSGADEDAEPEADGATGDAAEESASTDEGPDLSLLSDEERVEYLVEQNGGRMKQATIVKETGWSNAKVSQLLSAMEEEGRIAKLRIGRENLISFPDEDIGDFEDD